MNKENPKISIIVPMYNCAKYAPKCVENIINQTYQNWELFLVNGASCDGTTELCDQYAANDERIVSIHDIDGLVGARNVGYEKAEGDWIMYIDGDDWIDINTCKILVDNIRKNDSLDVIFFTYIQELNGKPIKGKWDWKKFEDGKIYKGNECHELALNTLNYEAGISTAYCKLINADYAKKYGIYHNKGLRQGNEGVEFSLRVFYYAKKSLFIKSPFYHYMYNPESLSKKPNEKGSKYITDCYRVMEEDIEKFDDKEIFYEYLKEHALYSLLSLAMNTYYHPANQDNITIKNEKFFKVITGYKLYQDALDSCDFSKFGIFRKWALIAIKYRHFSILQFISNIKVLLLTKGFFKY